MPESKESSSKNFFYFFHRYLIQSSPAASASYTLIAAVIFFCIIGFYIDNQYQTIPWFTLLGLIIGLIIGFNELAKIIWKK
ncbi:MAG: AtpZ/AtpI family protein [Candidatus Neomarinimicrobiota bacterium]|nr:AtpZ/AtpI family protein [Candidatus Neomarinimicrobiota bacterium]